MTEKHETKDERAWGFAHNGEDWEQSREGREGAITDALDELVSRQERGETFGVGDEVTVWVARCHYYTPDRWLDVDRIILDMVSGAQAESGDGDYPMLFSEPPPLRLLPERLRGLLAPDVRAEAQRRQVHVDALQEELCAVVRRWCEKHGYKPSWWVPREVEEVTVRVLDVGEWGDIEDWTEINEDDSP